MDNRKGESLVKATHLNVMASALNTQNAGNGFSKDLNATFYMPKKRRKKNIT
jgi:hypothetical protein